MGEEKELHKGLIPFLNCTDYTVSQETYEVMLNKEYEMLVTSPIPVDLENYYKSDAYISHTDSQKTIFDKVYQSVKKYALQKKLKLINSFENSEKTILDIGAGTGDFLKVCKEGGWQVFGVEPNREARERAASKTIQLEKELDFFEGQQFDVITLWHVLEHVVDLPSYIRMLEKLLKENGTLVIAVPNYKSYDAKHYKEFWAAYDVPRHLWHFSQTAIKKFFAKVHMEVIAIAPLKFDAYYVALLSEKYKKGKTNPIKALYIGWLSNRRAKRTSEYSSLIYMLKKAKKG